MDEPAEPDDDGHRLRYCKKDPREVPLYAGMIDDYKVLAKIGQ